MDGLAVVDSGRSLAPVEQSLRVIVNLYSHRVILPVQREIDAETSVTLAAVP